MGKGRRHKSKMYEKFYGQAYQPKTFKTVYVCRRCGWQRPEDSITQKCQKCGNSLVPRTVKAERV